MRILVTSASGANGNGYGAILGFGPEGEFTGPFSSDPRIAYPRGLSLDPSGALVYLNSGDDRMLALDLRGNVVRDSGRIRGLDPGGGEFGPDGRYCVTMRRQRTILAMPAALDREGEFLLPEGIVPFPRGFGFGRDGRLYLSSGVAPSGQGDNTIVVFDRSGTLRTPRMVTDTELSPLDLKFAPNGNIMVAEVEDDHELGDGDRRQDQPAPARVLHVLHCLHNGVHVLSSGDTGTWTAATPPSSRLSSWRQRRPGSYRPAQ